MSRMTPPAGPMHAAIYARKSTNQSGVAVAERSVTRQIKQARAYAAQKGWAVDATHVYVDDGISGAEFATRPGFLRLMNALKPRPPFQVLIMSEESRLGREAIETAFALKQLVQAGVRIFFYLEDRERTLDSPTDKIMLSLTTFADELEREKARQRTYDAMVQKAKAGHVTGGVVFGYDNVRQAEGPVVRRINAAEADVVRDIFQRYVAGRGMRGIAKALNEQRARCPRPRGTGPAGWAPSSVWAVLRRPLYRGEIVWGRTKKRDRWGQRNRSPRDEGQWVHVDVPHLRIVSERLWQAAQARRGEARTSYLSVTQGEPFGRPPNHRESKYLLTGFVRCAVCGGSLIVGSRSHRTHRAFFYECASFHRRGPQVCANSLNVPLATADDAILGEVENYVLHPKVVTRALALALDELRPGAGGVAEDRRRLQAEVQGVEKELARLTEALAVGGQLTTVVVAIQAREQRLQALRDQLVGLDRVREFTAADGRRLERDLRVRLADWRTLLRGQVQEARQIIRALIADRLTFTPTECDGQRVYRYEGTFSIGSLVSGVIDAQQRGRSQAFRVGTPSTPGCVSWHSWKEPWIRSPKGMIRSRCERNRGEAQDPR